jgi:hypothetical protein
VATLVVAATVVVMVVVGGGGVIVNLTLRYKRKFHNSETT